MEARLSAGLYTLQLIDASLGYIATAKHKGLRQQVMHGLYEGGSSLHAVHANVHEFAQSLGEVCTQTCSLRHQIGDDL